MKISNSIKYFKKNLAYIFSKKEFVLDEFNYDLEWSKDKKFENNPRFLAIGSVIDSQCSVLDLGCGKGELLNFLKKEKMVLKLMGVDGSAVGVEMCNEKGIPVIKSELLSVDYSSLENYDYVILSEVIEHIRDCEKMMLKLKKLFNRRLIVTIPNIGYIWYRLRLLFGRFPVDENRPPQNHIRFWTQKDFLIWAKQLGFEVQLVRGCGGFPILWKYWPSLFSRNNLYLLK